MSQRQHLSYTWTTELVLWAVDVGGNLSAIAYRTRTVKGLSRYIQTLKAKLLILDLLYLRQVLLTRRHRYRHLSNRTRLSVHGLAIRTKLYFYCFVCGSRTVRYTSVPDFSRLTWDLLTQGRKFQIFYFLECLNYYTYSKGENHRSISSDAGYFPLLLSGYAWAL